MPWPNFSFLVRDFFTLARFSWTFMYCVEIWEQGKWSFYCVEKGNFSHTHTHWLSFDITPGLFLIRLFYVFTFSYCVPGSNIYNRKNMAALMKFSFKMRGKFLHLTVASSRKFSFTRIWPKFTLRLERVESMSNDGKCIWTILKMNCFDVYARILFSIYWVSRATFNQCNGTGQLQGT